MASSMDMERTTIPMEPSTLENGKMDSYGVIMCNPAQMVPQTEDMRYELCICIILV